MVAHHGDVRTAAHVFYKLVGGTEYRPVGQYHHRFLPSHALAGFQFLGLEGGEIVVSTSRLVLEIAHGNLFVGKACGQLLGSGELASTIAADVENQTVAGCKERENLVQIALAKPVCESGAPHVADVVVEYTVIDARRDAVVGAEIAARERVGEIGGIILAPTPVSAHVESGIEVDMPVAQFGEHVAQHLKLLAACHGIRHLRGIAGVHLVPVHSLGIEKAVVLVHDAPQCLEVSGRRVGIFVLVHTAGKPHREEEDNRQPAEDRIGKMHGRHG